MLFYPGKRQLALGGIIFLKNRGVLNSTKLAFPKPGIYRINASDDYGNMGSSEKIEITGAESLKGIEIKLRKSDGFADAGSISGCVKNEKNEPLPNISVWLAESGGYDEERFKEFGTISRKDGTYLIKTVPPGVFNVSTSSDIYLKSSIKAVVVKAKTETKNVDLVLKEGQKVSGFVKDEEGKPIENATIALLRDKGLRESPYFRYEEVNDFFSGSNKDGLYTIKGIDNRRLAICCSKYGYIEQIVKLPPETSAMDFVLKKAPSLKGRVLNESDGKPVENFKIKVTAKNELPFIDFFRYFYEANSERYFYNQTDGSFLLENLREGSLKIWVIAESYKPKAVTHELMGNTIADLGNIKLTKAPIIKITVVDEETRAPIDSVRVYYEPDRSFSDDYERNYTDENGIYLPWDALPGQNQFAFLHEDYGEKYVILDVPQNGDMQITITLTKLISYEGLVVSKDDNKHVPDADVTIEHQGYRTSTAKSDSTGKFMIDKVAPGKIKIDIKHPDYKRFIQMIEFKKGDSPREFHLEKKEIK